MKRPVKPWLFELLSHPGGPTLCTTMTVEPPRGMGIDAPLRGAYLGRLVALVAGLWSSAQAEKKSTYPQERAQFGNTRSGLELRARSHIIEAAFFGWKPSSLLGGVCVCVCEATRSTRKPRYSFPSRRTFRGCANSAV